MQNQVLLVNKSKVINDYEKVITIRLNLVVAKRAVNYELSSEASLKSLSCRKSFAKPHQVAHLSG